MSKSANLGDLAIAGLIERLESNAIWIADEHQISTSALRMLAAKESTFLTNRYDQHLTAKAAGIDSIFSDMAIVEARANSETLFFRVAKERTLVHRAINQAFEILPIGGRLYLSGFKDEGIKTHISRAEIRLGSKATIQRHKNQLYIAEIEKTTGKNQTLDDSDYANLREIKADDIQFCSKPGLYGWDKIDKGSTFLMEYLAGEGISLSNKRVLDLGCGYGYLSIKAVALNPAEIVATDNCAAALTACEKNLKTANVSVSVVPSNAGKEVTGKFDLILCNPPFHRGFSTTSNLHDEFIRQTKRLLASDGQAFYVVNQFLKIDALAKQQNLELTEVGKNASFKIIELTH